MENKSNQKLLLIITITALLTFILGATYAYFVASVGDGASANINITANTTDSLMFEVDNDLNININQENFAEGMENAHGTLQGRATLLANDKTNEATANYYVYLDITENSFIYTTEERTPEILLKVTTPTGEELTNLLGLDYVTVKETSGFDITERVDLINLSGLYTIEATNKKIDEWQVEIIVINLDSNQQANTGKNLNAKLILGTEKKEVGARTSLADVCTSGDNLADCIKSLQETSYYAKSKLLKHDSNLTNGAEDNSIRYTGGDENYSFLENVPLDTNIFGVDGIGYNVYYFSDDTIVSEKIPRYVEILKKANAYGEELTDEETSYFNEVREMINNTIFLNQITDCCYVISSDFKNKIDETNILKEDFDKSVKFPFAVLIYYLNDDEALLKMNKMSEILEKNLLEQEITSEERDFFNQIENYVDGREKNLFKYKGAAMQDAIEKNLIKGVKTNYINNYVCFGIENTCDEDHLYRIIGSFDESKNGEYNVKLVKNKSLGEIPFDETGQNIWQTSTINNDTLNGTYVTELRTYANYIKENLWKVGGTNTFEVTSKSILNKEKESQAPASKIGLMYVSDYGYSAYQKAWTKNLDDYDYPDVSYNNWLYKDRTSWTIMPYSESGYSINVGGNSRFYIYSSIDFDIYPVFYLNSNVKYTKGTGTMDDPYFISL